MFYVVDIFVVCGVKGGRLVIIYFSPCGYLKYSIYLINRYTFFSLFKVEALSLHVFNEYLYTSNGINNG